MAPSALFLHGAGGGGWEWRRWMMVWRAHGWHVRAPDLEPVDAGIAATEWNDYLAQTTRAIESMPEPRVVIGASLGGLLALAVASRAQALILINPLLPASWHRALPTRDRPDVVPWRTQGRLSSTRRAMPDADSASTLHAFRHWRDESGAVLRAAYSGIELDAPPVPTLLITARDDGDIPSMHVSAMARAWGSTIWDTEGGHLSPLVGPEAAALAARAVGWMNARVAAG